jgi:hypothetical protein
LKAGVLEDGAVYPSEAGTPQGGSISVLHVPTATSQDVGFWG